MVMGSGGKAILKWKYIHSLGAQDNKIWPTVQFLGSFKTDPTQQMFQPHRYSDLDIGWASKKL